MSEQTKKILRKPKPPKLMSDKEWNELEAWTNKKLDEWEEPSEDELIRIGARVYSMDQATAEQNALQIAKDEHAFEQLLAAHDRIELSLKRGDYREVERLVGTDIELWRYALRGSMARSKKPRHGNSREPDPVFFELRRYADVIKNIWNKNGRKVQESTATAEEFAARRLLVGVTAPRKLPDWVRRQFPGETSRRNWPTNCKSDDEYRAWCEEDILARYRSWISNDSRRRKAAAKGNTRRAPRHRMS